MATTTNYGWDTPDDTDLVKDGAAAIRTLGSSIDTTTKNLNPQTSTGAIAYRSATANVNTALAIGTAGQILQVNSGATAPEWATPAASGGMTLIQETSANADSSLTFGSIPSSYKQLMLIWCGIYVSGSGNVFSLRINNDSGGNYSVFDADFYDAPLNAAASAVVAGNNSATDATDTATFSNGPFGYNTTSSTLYNKQSQGTLIIDNYASTSKFKFYTVDWSHYIDGTTTGVSSFVKGVYKSTSAITSLDIYRAAGAGTFSNNTSTSIRLYGIS
jgi:hypothetical protein